MKISCVYIIKSVLYKNKIYIGSSVNFTVRKNEHLRDLRNGKHINKKLQRHANKYGIEDLFFEILERVFDRNLIVEKEQYYLDFYDPYFNILKKAYSPIGFKHSKESRAKISASRKGISYGPLSNEMRKKLSDIHKQNMTPERRKKISIALTGRPCSDETKNKIKLSQIGIPKNPESIRKMAISMKGKTHTEETKKKIGAYWKGRKRGPQSLEAKIKFKKTLEAKKLVA